MKKGSRSWRKSTCTSTHMLTSFKLSCGMWRTRTMGMKIVSRRLLKRPHPSSTILLHPYTLGSHILGSLENGIPTMRRTRKMNGRHQQLKLGGVPPSLTISLVIILHLVLVSVWECFYFIYLS